MLTIRIVIIRKCPVDLRISNASSLCYGFIERSKLGSTKLAAPEVNLLQHSFTEDSSVSSSVLGPGDREKAPEVTLGSR